MTEPHRQDDPGFCLPCESDEMTGWLAATRRLEDAGLAPLLPERVRTAMWRCGGVLAATAERLTSRANYWLAVAEDQCHHHAHPDEPVDYWPA